VSALAPFTALLRALTGGRYRPRPRSQPALPLEQMWYDLLARLGLPSTALDDVLAAGSLERHFHYRHFPRPKKDGGRRDITEPDSRLKAIQRAILARYLLAEPHPAAVAYRKKKSIADHIWPHVGAELRITADIEDFFPQTSAARVESWWREQVEDSLARLFTLLTTYQGGLPQGAPTSPALSNAVNRELDEHLARRASSAGACYTRYCDDIVFSWRDGYAPPSDFENGVRMVLHALGYRLHPTKGWRVHHRRDEPEITGVILTRHGRVRLPDRVAQAMRRLGGSSDPWAADRLAGYRAFEAMVCKRPSDVSPTR
jgi:hypothetical protein